MPKRVRRNRYLILRITPVLLIFLHIIIRTKFDQPSLLSDLVLFNSAAICAGISLLYTPFCTDMLARYLLASSCIAWAVGSIISTLDSFYPRTLSENYADISYALFYPLMLLGIYRAQKIYFQKQREIRGDILDVLIIGLSLSNLCAGLALREVSSQMGGSGISFYLSLIYPIGDVVILGFAFATIAIQRGNSRNLLVLLGLIVFTVTDLFFLWKSIYSQYSFASLFDDGWILGLILISESMWHPGASREISKRFNSVASTLSLLASTGVVAVSFFIPDFFPIFVIAIAGLTIGLSLLRLIYTLREVKHVSEQRELARTDELTGLPNRRKFLSEIDRLNSQSGTLMILDLDGFKKVNDRYGHSVGDQLLRTIAQRFVRVMPPHSELARLGGDEFGAIIFGGESEGLDTALALRATLSYPIDIGVEPIQVGVSIGRVFHQSTEAKLGKEEILRRADSAMYQAKREQSGTRLWSIP